jgi:hypothetical protein
LVALRADGYSPNSGLSPLKSTQRPDDQEQSKLFIKKAREIGADEENSAADELLRRMIDQERERTRKPNRLRGSYNFVV